MLNPLPANLTGWLIVFDLDDTLYYEAEYVESARKEIAGRIASRYDDAGLTEEEMLEIMRRHPFHGPGAFDALNAALPPHIASEADVLWMRRVYRSHFPDIRLRPETEALLATLVNRGATLGIITDGRVETQSLKLAALGITRFVESERISVSAAIGAEKYSAKPFVRMEQLAPDCNRRLYVGDNPAKDFLHPKAMGWATVMLRHPQSGPAIFADRTSDYPESHNAEVTIDSLEQLLCVPIADM